MITVQFLGCGDAFGSGGRFNTCFHVSGNGAGGFLIDCGATSLVAMRRFGVEPNDVGTVLVSHLHGDHIGGLPFLILDGLYVGGRTAPLTLVGPPGLGQRLTDLTHALYPGILDKPRRFAIETIEFEPERRIEVGGLAVTPYPVPHGNTPSFALRIEAGGRILAYSSDTEVSDALIPAGRDADLFICESTSFDTPLPGHVDYRSLRALLPRIGARRVVLTHLGPESLANLDRFEYETSEDGMVVPLPG